MKEVSSFGGRRLTTDRTRAKAFDTEDCNSRSANAEV